MALKDTKALNKALGYAYLVSWHNKHEKRANVVGPFKVHYGEIVGRTPGTTVYYAIKAWHLSCIL